MKIGIDIGGSHIAVGIVEDGKIIAKKENDILEKNKENIEEFLVKSITNNINEIIKETNSQEKELELIGIAVPGTVKDGIIVKSTNLGIENFNIILELKKYFKTNFNIRNDAKCATLAEQYYGSMKNYSDFVYICLGTGIGSGVVLDNKLIQPKKYEGLELGHMVIEKNGIQCTCGRKGCWEQYAAMKKLRKKLIEYLNLNENSISFEILKELENRENDENINLIINEYTNNLAVGIANIINIFEPEAICIGGSFVHYEELLLNKLIEKLKEKNATYNNNVPNIVCAELKNDAGMIGATI